MPALHAALALGYGAARVLRNCAIALSLGAGLSNAEPITVVALGDSLTAGYGLAQDQGLVPQLQAWLAAKGADVQVVNAGVSGDTTAGGLSRVDWSLTPETDALIVSLGGNDVLRGLDPASVRANLDGILAKAKARDLPVLLVGIRAPGNYGPDYRAAFDAIYPDLATKYSALLIPNFFAALADQDPKTIGRDMLADGIHPNADGVTKIVKTLGPQVIELVGQVKP